MGGEERIWEGERGYETGREIMGEDEGRQGMAGKRRERECGVV